MRCKKCQHFNPHGATECESCGVLFKDLRREDAPKQRGPATCAFEGRAQCYCRGIISASQNGDGPWYCREHWEVLNGRPALVRGNAVPEYQRMPGAEERDARWRRWLETRDRRVLPGVM